MIIIYFTFIQFFSNVQLFIQIMYNLFLFVVQQILQYYSSYCNIPNLKHNAICIHTLGSIMVWMYRHTLSLPIRINPILIELHSIQQYDSSSYKICLLGTHHILAVSCLMWWSCATSGDLQFCWMLASFWYFWNGSGFFHHAPQKQHSCHIWPHFLWWLLNHSEL